MSRPLWNGTVVLRPSACLNCLCEPRWRASLKPSRLRSATTFAWLEDGHRAHGLTHLQGLRTHELAS